MLHLLLPLVLHLLQLEPVLAPVDFAVANFPDSQELGQHFSQRPLNVQDKGSIPRQLL
jgi:hypothetical protein